MTAGTQWTILKLLIHQLPTSVQWFTPSSIRRQCPRPHSVQNTSFNSVAICSTANIFFHTATGVLSRTTDYYTTPLRPPSRSFVYLHNYINSTYCARAHERMWNLNAGNVQPVLARLRAVGERSRCILFRNLKITWTRTQRCGNGSQRVRSASV